MPQRHRSRVNPIPRAHVRVVQAVLRDGSPRRPQSNERSSGQACRSQNPGAAVIGSVAPGQCSYRDKCRSSAREVVVQARGNLGYVLYEILTGQRAFRADTVIEPRLGLLTVVQAARTAYHAGALQTVNCNPSTCAPSPISTRTVSLCQTCARVVERRRWRSSLRAELSWYRPAGRPRNSYKPSPVVSVRYSPRSDRTVMVRCETG